ncbi:MAG: hypothetical protein ACREPR_08690, partial [Brasilonema sp.]
LLTRANLYRGVGFVQISPLVGNFVQIFRSGVTGTKDKNETSCFPCSKNCIALTATVLGYHNQVSSED